MIRRFAVIVLVPAIIAFATPVFADTVIITSNTTVNDGDTSLDNRDVIVRGAVLTVDGAHAFNSLTIERNASNDPGVVTHDPGFFNGSVNGVSLTIAGSMSVQGAADPLVASRLDLDGRGFSAGNGPGAG